jgi:hypothetical protein
MTTLPNEEAIELPKPENSHLEVIRQDQSLFEIPDHIDKILDRKFDRHIVPWLFGIWCVGSPAKIDHRQELTSLGSLQAIRVYR